MSKKKILLDEVLAYGHPKVLGTHRTTLEITTENFLTTRGNCIIGINASKSCANLTAKLKKVIQESGKRIEVDLRAGPFQDNFSGKGDLKLELSNSTSIVFRLSPFISDRTALIHCTKASFELDRELIRYMQDPDHTLLVQFYEYGDD